MPTLKSLHRHENCQLIISLDFKLRLFKAISSYVYDHNTKLDQTLSKSKNKTKITTTKRSFLLLFLTLLCIYHSNLTKVAETAKHKGDIGTKETAEVVARRVQKSNTWPLDLQSSALTYHPGTHQYHTTSLCMIVPLLHNI